MNSKLKNGILIFLVLFLVLNAKENIQSKGSLTIIKKSDKGAEKTIEYCDILKIKIITEKIEKTKTEKKLIYYKNKLLYGSKTFKTDKYFVTILKQNEALIDYINKNVFSSIKNGINGVLKENQYIRKSKSKKLKEVLNNKIFIDNTSFSYLCFLDTGNAYNDIGVKMEFDFNNNFKNGSISRGMGKVELTKENYLLYTTEECSLVK